MGFFGTLTDTRAVLRKTNHQNVVKIIISNCGPLFLLRFGEYTFFPDRVGLDLRKVNQRQKCLSVGI